jgi:hypothetical protein
MTTTLARRSRVRKDFRALVREAKLYILCAPLSARQVARDIGASPATTARVLAALRRELKAKGGELVSVRRGRRWHYEIRENNPEAWKRLDKLIGSIPCEPLQEEDHDRVIYTYP